MSWIEKAVDQFDRWANKGGSPPHKKSKNAGGDQVNCPEGELMQHTWVSKGITQALAAFGQQVEQQLQPLRTGLETHGEAIDNLQKQNELLSKRISELEAKEPEKMVQELQDKVQQACNELDSYKPKARITPNEDRTNVARMGGLGWDMDRNQVKTVALECLQNAGVDSSTYSDVTAVRNKGSLVECLFTSPLHLDRARVKVKAAELKLPNSKSNVWLDFKKSEEVLKKERACLRAREYPTDLAASKSSTFTVVVDKPAGKVMVNTKQIAWVLRGKLKPTKEAYGLMSNEEVEIMTDYANDGR